MILFQRAIEPVRATRPWTPSTVLATALQATVDQTARRVGYDLISLGLMLSFSQE